MTKKPWKGPNVEAAHVSKSDHTDEMRSTFHSHELALCFPLTGEQSTDINKHHKGKMYIDDEAEMATQQPKPRNPLTTSPFIQEFEYGQSNQGICTNEWSAHSVIVFIP